MTLQKKLLTLEETIEKLNEWKKGLTPEDLKSIINQFEDPVNKLIAKKILLEKEN